MYFTFVEQVRARLAESDVPTPVAQAYLQLLTNLNALSMLMAPDGDDDLNSPETAHLTRLFAQHQRRRVQMEEEYPILAVLSRPAGWRGN
ncbi:hypothetical protein [Deinococcus sp. DB0503]|uniref:hypothetical protein n=1 Tax=Deinococcus sp. DB0503 TaxID=2479203 RepID=UPI0018DF64D4|nr:hypothetical protein [Deinococcus sp. DB0503]MBI0445346.1 hypothetical protein [Deinococcus sp. DB0503]